MIFRYPTDLSSESTYITFTRVQSKGFTTKELQSIDKAEFASSPTALGIIALPVPNQFVDSSSVTYEGLEDRDLLTQGLKNVSESTQTIQKVVKASERFKATKLAAQNTLMFSSVQVKTFSLSWNLIPRSLAEAESIESIIKEFELAKLPYYAENSSFQNFPDYFNIKFGGVDPVLIKFLPSVITNIETNITPSGHFQMYESGHFPEVSLSVTFGELTSRTREIQQRLYDS